MAIAERDLLAGLMVGLDSDPASYIRQWVRRPPWMASAACRGSDVTFITDRGESTAEAKALCAECPVAGECLDYALADPHLDGVWAGTTTRDRKRMRALVPSLAQRQPIRKVRRAGDDEEQPPPVFAEEWCECGERPVAAVGRCRPCNQRVFDATGSLAC